jgi:hypothetical protein
LFANLDKIFEISNTFARLFALFSNMQKIKWYDFGGRYAQNYKKIESKNYKNSMLRFMPMEVFIIFLYNFFIILSVATIRKVYPLDLWSLAARPKGTLAKARRQEVIF